MASPGVKMSEKEGVVTLTFVQSLGKATKVNREVVLVSPTNEEIRNACMVNLNQIRTELGYSGRLTDDNSG